jgi:hypothetical protein
MTRASYTSAIAWLAANDDNEWVEHNPDSGPGSMSVTGAMTCDLFGVDAAKLRADLTKELIRIHVRTRSDGAFGGSAIYRGDYYFGGRWEVAKNKLDLPLAYMTEAAALAGAKVVLGERFAEGQK